MSLATSYSLARFGFKISLRGNILIAVQLLTFSLLVVIFGSIFKITPFEQLGEGSPVNYNTIMWYFIIVEMITFCGGATNFTEVRNDILNGDFTSSLQRPKSYAFINLLMVWGGNLYSCTAFILCGIALGLFLTDEIPFGIREALLVIPSIFLGTFLCAIINYLTAMIEVWGAYARPAMWIIQKFMFLLGGLIIPIQIYPEFLQKIAYFTPFPAVLNMAGSFALHPSMEQMVLSLGIQLFWLLVLLGAVFLVQHFAYQKIMKQGH